MTDDNNNKSSVGFSIDASDEGHNPPPRRASKRSSLRSSFFRLRSMSFRRSGGDRGADINTLRGTNGPDFEGYATINRADGVLLCNCFGGYKKDKKEKILLIKGPYLFVFVKESDPTPKYAVELAHMKAVMKHASGGVQHMTIETSLGDVEWDLTFQQQQIAKQFADAFRQQAAVGEAEEVQKRLGHDNLHKKRSSVKYAETVATKKTGEVPKKKENPTLEELNREAGFMTGL